MFNCIRVGVMDDNDYFRCKRDAVGKPGLSSYQKCAAAIRMLSYGVVADLVNECMRMSESTCLESMYKFCKVVVQVFGLEYLRKPNAIDTAGAYRSMLREGVLRCLKT